MRTWKIAACFIFASACGDSGGVVDLGDGTAIEGLGLRASVVELDVTESTGSRIKMVSTEVVLTNETDAAAEYSYPAGCPVRMRLYNLVTDQLVYDQTIAACNVSTIVPLTIGAGQSRTLTSGARFPWEVGGDSIPPATYRATAVLRITGENPVELEAGMYRLPTCNLAVPIKTCD